MPKLTKKFSIPIVFIFYNRPDYVDQAFVSLREIKPKKIYLVADGPKNNQEKKLTDETRKLVEQNITWPAKVIKIYASRNMGLRNRIVSGLNQVFEKEETAIILEDDCVSNPSFFVFTEQLLIKYKNNKHIGSITGDNFLFNKKTPQASYYFSQYPHSWGWATWKRAWKLFDNEMTDWQQVWKNHHYSSPLVKYYWYLIFTAVSKLKIDSWAYRWTYSSFKHNLLTIIPAKNLVKNIGFGEQATNTKYKSNVNSLKANKINFPLKHPSKIKQNEQFDALTEKHLYIKLRTILGALVRYIQ
ncbi:MAG: glycosyltransferase family 2 protein [Patescibacteria group bacterium]